MRGKKIEFSIRKKMLYSYLVIVALILLVGSFGIYNIQRVYRNGNAIYVNNLKSIEYLKSINQNVKEIDQCLVSMMGPFGKEKFSSSEKRIAHLMEENQELMDKYSEIKVSKLERRRYKQCRLSIMTFDKYIDATIELLKKNTDTTSTDADKKALAVTSYEQELMPVKACTYELIEAIVELATDNARLKNEENRSVFINLVWVNGIVMVFSIFLAVLITFRMSGNFKARLDQIRELAIRLSEYNVSDDIEETGNDEFGETMAALNESQFMLRDLLEKITDESATIDNIGGEVSEAIRKSSQKIEAVNVDLYNVEDAIAQLESYAKNSIDAEISAQNITKVLQDVSQKCQASMDWMQEMQTELTGIATYLEQIGITAEYQNEIANKHRAQVERFRVSREAEQDDEEVSEEVSES